MSYILDALKKADQERMAGDVPDLESVHETRHTSRGFPRWIWVILALLVVNGVLLVVLLDGKDAAQQQPADVIATQPTVPVPPASVRQMPVVPTQVITPSTAVASRPMPVMPEPVISRPVMLAAPDKPVVVAKQPKVEPARPKVEFATEPLTPVSGVESAGLVATVQPVSPPVEIATAPPLLIPIPVVDPQPVIMPQPTVRQSTGGQKTGVPYWAELPLDYRASFDLPQLDVHVYSETPAKRFILVNLRKYREGDELPNGIDLDEILQDGLLLTYGGRQFHMRK